MLPSTWWEEAIASRTSLRLVTRPGRRRDLSNWILVPAVLLVGGLGGALLGALPEQDLARLFNPPVAHSTVATAPKTFAVCAGSVRIDCVVDGDTFWLDGVKIRIAD